MVTSTVAPMRLTREALPAEMKQDSRCVQYPKTRLPLGTHRIQVVNPFSGDGNRYYWRVSTCHPHMQLSCHEPGLYEGRLGQVRPVGP